MARSRVMFLLLIPLTTLTLAPATASGQGSYYVRPDGNGYYFHNGPRPYRPPVPYRPDIDDAIVHEDLDVRERDRAAIYDTGVRYGQLTPAQRRALADELSRSRESDGAYHQGYHRGRDARVAPVDPYWIPPYGRGDVVPYRPRRLRP